MIQLTKSEKQQFDALKREQASAKARLDDLKLRIIAEASDKFHGNLSRSFGIDIRRASVSGQENLTTMLDKESTSLESRRTRLDNWETRSPTSPISPTSPTSATSATSPTSALRRIASTIGKAPGAVDFGSLRDEIDQFKSELVELSKRTKLSGRLDRLVEEISDAESRMKDYSKTLRSEFSRFSMDKEEFKPLDLEAARGELLTINEREKLLNGVRKEAEVLDATSNKFSSWTESEILIVNGRHVEHCQNLWQLASEIDEGLIFDASMATNLNKIRPLCLDIEQARKQAASLFALPKPEALDVAKQRLGEVSHLKQLASAASGKIASERTKMDGDGRRPTGVSIFTRIDHKALHYADKQLNDLFTTLNELSDRVTAEHLIVTQYHEAKHQNVTEVLRALREGQDDLSVRRSMSSSSMGESAVNNNKLKGPGDAGPQSQSKGSDSPKVLHEDIETTLMQLRAVDEELEPPRQAFMDRESSVSDYEEALNQKPAQQKYIILRDQSKRGEQNKASIIR